MPFRKDGSKPRKTCGARPTASTTESDRDRVVGPSHLSVCANALSLSTMVPASAKARILPQEPMRCVAVTRQNDAHLAGRSANGGRLFLTEWLRCAREQQQKVDARTTLSGCTQLRKAFRPPRA